jgi:hypothetical protein
MFTDGPFLESKEYLAGFRIIEAPRPRRGARARHREVEALQPEDRGAAVPVNRVGIREAITQAHHEEWARVVAVSGSLPYASVLQSNEVTIAMLLRPLPLPVPP